MTNKNQFKEKQIKYNTYLNNNKDKILTTLDIKHNEKIKEFENYNKIIEKKKLRINKILDKLHHIEKINIKIAHNDN